MFPGQAIRDLWNTKVALGQDFLQVLGFSSITVIKPTLLMDIYLNVVCTRRTNGRSLKTLRRAMPFRKTQRALDRNVPSHFISHFEWSVGHWHRGCVTYILTCICLMYILIRLFDMCRVYARSAALGLLLSTPAPKPDCRGTVCRRARRIVKNQY